MLVKHNNPTFFHLTNNKGEIVSSLIPGVNKIDLETWLEYREHPIVKAMLAEGTLEEEQDIEEVKASGDKGDIHALKGLRLSNAKSLIKETMDKILLNQWLQVEEKDNVKDLIKKQLEDLEKPLEKRDRSKSRQVTTGKGPEMVELEATPNASDD